jgi:PAS domain-containing protein
MSELVGVFPPSLDRDPLRRALDCLEEGFQIIGYDWHYVYLNPAAARHGRRAVEELIGHSIFEEYPGIYQTALFGRLRRSMEERIPQVFETEFTFPDGSKRWFELRSGPRPKVSVCTQRTSSRGSGGKWVRRERTGRRCSCECGVHFWGVKRVDRATGDTP